MNIKTFKLNDLELVNEIKAGNKNAEEVLYKKYRQKLTRYLRYKKYNEFDLDDCVSEILIKIFEKISSYDNSKSSFSTWVSTITNNHIINKSKIRTLNVTTLSYNSDDTNSVYYANNSEINLTMTNSFTTDVSVTSDMAEALNIDNSYTMNIFSNVVNDRDFNMLKMKYVEGYTYNEIGQHYSLTSNTVSNRVNYIKTVISKNKKA